MRTTAVVALGACLVACTPHASSRAGTGTGTSASAGPSANVGAAAAVDAGATELDLHDAAADVPAEEPAPGFDEILRVLFAEKTSAAPILAACPVSLPGDARVRCLYDERYKGDAKAAAIALELYVKWRIVAGVEVPHTMDGGYRGMIEIRPAVPVGENRHHLEWVAGAIRDFDTFFGELEKSRGGEGRSVLFTPNAKSPKPYRFQPITLRFMRSVAPARTPAAYAHDWDVAYNFVGTLNISADAVRETMFHEIFHLNDAAHGGWSPKALGEVFDFVAHKCGINTACLTPYTPNETMVRGGTYYSFVPGNGVMEYAAELALRYYREQRAALRHLAKVKPFKCGPPENAKAWTAMKDEFFAGIDAVPACP
ncbi:MAG: hypothetical protein JWP87_5928 [Labilithrix sp.]|nr:hypothetical protein [Labilithrix sp.]